MSDHMIVFNRDVFTCTPPRPLEVTDAELKRPEEEIARSFREVME